MKKNILVLLSVLLLSVTLNVATAKPAATNPATSAAIKLYKSGNYTGAYNSLKEILNKDQTNALAYYYLAMTEVRLGKIDDAIENYSRVMQLSPNGVLGSYAKKGKKCVETPEKCHEPEVSPSKASETDEDRFIKGAYGSGFSKDARGVYEKHKIDSLKRDINRQDELPPQRFKEYKDFSSEVPTNDEIVSALRTLQRAGLSDVMPSNRYASDVSNLLGNDNSSSRAGYDMLNMLLNQNNSSTTSNLSPQVIQSLLTTQMTAGF